jgi:hypothetical protein
MLCFSESVDFLSILDMYFPVFLVLLVCVCSCHGVHRQTNRHSREISEIGLAHARARSKVEVTHTPLSCGGDECERTQVCMFVCFLF